MSSSNFQDKDDQEYVFCRYIKKNGKIIYPKKAKFFKFPKKK